MADHISGKSIIITGAGGGFGKLVASKAAERGARVTCADIDEDALAATVAEITATGASAQSFVADVTDPAAMRRLAAAAVDAYGRIDVMINNAGIMPLALYADHEAALDHWHRCIDINIKGVLNGMVAVFDQMMSQSEGHIINVSSIYGNFPTFGAGVYGASKSAVNFLSESLRVEARGKIKVTIIKPTGVPGTGLGAGVINREGIVGIVGQNAGDYFDLMEQFGEGTLDPARLDPERMDYVALSPEYIADAIIHAIDQPKGVSIGDITVRASGDHYIL